MNIKRYISAVLALLMLIGVFTAFSTVSIFAADEKKGASNDEEAVEEEEDEKARDYLTYVYYSPQEKLDSMKLMLEKFGWQLYIEEYTGEVAWRNATTGQVHFTNPYDVAAGKGTSDTKTKLLSQVIIKFTDNNKDNQKYIDDLNFDITNLKISVSSFDESSTSIDELIERIDQDINNNKASVENKKTLREKILEDNKMLEEQIVSLNEQIEQMKQEVLTSGDKVDYLKQERIEKNEELTKTEEEITNQFRIIEDLKAQITKQEVKKSKIEYELEQTINKMWEDYELTPNNVGEEYKKPENVGETSKKVKQLRDQIKALGSINIDSIEEYKQTKERYDFMCEQRLDLEDSSSKLKKVIQDMTKIMKEQFEKQFKVINKNFGEVFSELFGGGKAELRLTDEENILECGIEIEAQPPGKKLQNMMLLSGGEKAFTAIALLFAILKINPAPFCVLDEIEAALDDVNVYRFADYLKKYTKNTQFLVITHRKGTMEAADTVYGITMEENGISKLLSMKLK